MMQPSAESISMLAVLIPAFMMLGFVAIVLAAVFFSYRAEKKRKSVFLQMAALDGYQPLDAPSSQLVAQSSFSVGTIPYGFAGVLKGTGNQFSAILQKERRGSGKSSRTYLRSIVVVDIPDTQLQLIVNSKINNDSQSGGNLAHYTNKQRVVLEGDFGTFFDLYMPETTQSESLSLLAPNSMWVILRDFADYDIEISGNKLFVYTYKHLTQQEFKALLAKLEVLLEAMWLRKDDVRPEKETNNLVARTAADASTEQRRLQRSSVPAVIGIVFFIGVLILHFTTSNTVMSPPVIIFAAALGLAVLAQARQNRLRKKYDEAIRSYGGKDLLQ